MTPVSFNSDRYSVTDPAFSKDGQKLFFSSDMPGSFGASDIFYCTREGKGWSQPIHLGPEVNTAGREVFPSLDSAGNLFFSSDGFGGFGGLDICVALNKNGSYSQASPMKMPFNSATDDFGLSFVKNERSGYFSSNRSGGEGDDDIYYFDLDQDSIKIPASIYTIGYKIPEAMARIHVSIFENPGQAPIQNGLFAYVDPLTKATDTLHFKNGTVDFSVPGKSEVVMDIVPTGFTPLKDSLQIGHVRKDTLINLVYNFANNTLSNAGPAVTNVDPRNMTMSFELKNIFFDFNKYDIRTSDQQAIDSVAEYLKSHPRSRVEIDAYADSRGTAEYNFNLSNERAQSAIKYLASKGIARNRMKPVGYGYTHLFNNCVKGVDCTEAEHQQNRRVVFHFFDSKTK
jgi:peptidoglycan-associated lipoprotein